MLEEYLRFERDYLSPYAVKSSETRGRLHPIEPCPLRTDFQRDRDRILHCKTFRRLKHKTQVFLSPTGDHYRTRLTHTLEVTQIARTIARALRLNEDLTEAIGLGHDLGHTPFGHTGERVLDKRSGHFAHNEQSLRVVDLLENGGEGLNLTFEVRDGILNHRIDGHPATLEGKVISIADRIAYLNHDTDDAIRAGLLNIDDIPKDVTDVVGKGKGKMIDAFVSDVVKMSLGKPDIIQSEPYISAMNSLRKFMFDNIYTKSKAKVEEVKADRIVALLFDYYTDNLDVVPSVYKIHTRDSKRIVSDYIANMSDTFALHQFREIFEPKFWED